MSPVRVYVPTSLAGLRAMLAAGGLGPAPLLAHAVTRALRAQWPDAGDEEWEYAASAAAAQASLGLLARADCSAPRRVVVAVDVAVVREQPAEADPTVVEVEEVVPLRRVAAVLVDDATAEADVRAGADRWAAAQDGDPGAVRAVERCQDHDLGWFATQEIDQLLG